MAPKIRIPHPSPEPLWEVWDDPPGFSEALKLHIERHGENVHQLARAATIAGETLDRNTLGKWIREVRAPQSVDSLRALDWIERRYHLPEGSLRAKLPHQGRASRRELLHKLTIAEQRRLTWHLPDDFERRPAAEQAEILDWVRRIVISGSTEYRRYQSAMARQRFGLRFSRPIRTGSCRRASASIDSDGGGTLDAPRRLQDEMAELVRFKTSTLVAYGLQRNGVWCGETASQKIEHFGLMFGALAASPKGEVRGRGVRPAALTFAMLVFPSVWDWYLQWRERRRGFYTAWEADMLINCISLVRADTGWLRQKPDIARNLEPVAGLISRDDVYAARRDWTGTCEAMFAHARQRFHEIKRVVRVHHDAFEPILPILEAKSPVGEYRKIAEEIQRRIPDQRRYPKAAAEGVRSLLMIRLGLHLGIRQKNLRELLLCDRQHEPSSERALEDRRYGELRWSDRESGWEVLIPAVAFKNAGSSFFGSKPFRLLLPDLGGLYSLIDDWIERHRPRLLASARDPGTFFIKSVKRATASAAYDQNTFYEAWRLTIQRYGIFNPYTGRGAIPGLLPHGPHSVRDVLATHILKQTGSFEKASYAIQDTPAIVAKHYARFLPQDKTAIAAAVLNEVWKDC